MQQILAAQDCQAAKETGGLHLLPVLVSGSQPKRQVNSFFVRVLGISQFELEKGWMSRKRCFEHRDNLEHP